MREPRRLLEQDASDAERALLRSAHADGPPSGAPQRIMLALEALTPGNVTPEATGQALGSSASPVAVQSLKLGALAKIGLAALVGAGAVGGGALVHRLANRPTEAVETSPVLALQATLPRADESAARPKEAPPAAPPLANSERHEAPAPAIDSSLGAELRLLDAARAAMEAGDLAAAKRHLDRYAGRFPRGRLEPEAAVLRLAVLVRQGDHVAARALAHELLDSETYKTYQSRIRTLLRQADQ